MQANSAPVRLAITSSLLGRLIRTLAIGSASGFVAGLVAGGVGSRVAMRISGMLTPAELQGTITDAGAVVGKITAGGSLFLLMLGAFVGVGGGLVYIAVRPWTSGAGARRGALFGAILFATLGSTVFERDNPDFTRLGPLWLNLAMFGALFPLFGVVVDRVYCWLDRRVPFPARGMQLPYVLFYAVALLVMLLPTFSVLSGFARGEIFFLHPQGALATYLILGLPAVALVVARLAGRFECLEDLRANRAAQTLAWSALGLPILAGLILDAEALAGIVAGPRR